MKYRWCLFLMLYSCVFMTMQIMQVICLEKYPKSSPRKPSRIKATYFSWSSIHSIQELISRWDSKRERFYDDIVHVEASAYAHWTDFLSMLIYAAANQGRSSTSFIMLHCEPSSTIGWSSFSNVLAANHLCTYAHQTKLSEFVLPK